MDGDCQVPRFRWKAEKEEMSKFKEDPFDLVEVMRNDGYGAPLQGLAIPAINFGGGRYDYEGVDLNDKYTKVHWFHNMCLKRPHQLVVQFHGPENNYIYMWWGYYDRDYSGHLITNCTTMGGSGRLVA